MHALGRGLAAVVLALAVGVGAAVVPAEAATRTTVTATVLDRSVLVQWSRLTRGDVLLRDGVPVARLAKKARRFEDRAVKPGEVHVYALASHRSQASVRLPAYLVGAANRSITPAGVVNLGGFGLGDGRLLPEDAVGRGSQGFTKKERIRTRATVFDDGRSAVAIASIETQGMFAAYADGPYGLQDMAARVAQRIPGLPAHHILIAADHSHSAPDTIGAWGGVASAYLQFIADRTVDAIVDAYQRRGFADVRVGSSDASDLIYNQSCSEALNQDETPAYTGPELCATPGKDGMVRVVQARSRWRGPIVTFMSYAAHATAGGGDGIHGDWPQFLSDAMAAKYGGFGQAMVGALGGTQPCRAACAFTKTSNPGYRMRERKPAIVTNYLAHVDAALRNARSVVGPVAGAQTFIREPIVGAPVLALFTAGSLVGARLMRAHEPPWTVGPTIRTVVGALRVGGVVFAGVPGEGFPAISDGVRAAVDGEQAVIPLGLTNDQLGYLIAPARYVPVIAAQVAINDNILFNVSPTIGDHVMCAEIALVARLGFPVTAPPDCVLYDTLDALGDPLAAVPVGAPMLP